jgi:hypothetical protein
MKKKNSYLIVVVLVAVLLIAAIIWIYTKRIERIESKMKIPIVSVYRKLLLNIWGEISRKMTVILQQNIKPHLHLKTSRLRIL